VVLNALRLLRDRGEFQAAVPASTRQAGMRHQGTAPDETLYILIPLSIVLVFVIGALFGGGQPRQFDDLEQPGKQI
jgi:cbb3-type cytochrome oxidase maturation protein